MKRGLAALAASAVWLPAVMAGPVPRTQVGAPARWLLHLDLERFSATQLSALLTSPAAGATPFRAALTRYQQMLGIDPVRDLANVTLYGYQSSGDRGVALINGKLNGTAIREHLRSHAGYQERLLGKRPAYTWKDPASGKALWACFHTERLLVVASDDPMLGEAVGVLDGGRANLTTGRGLITVPAGPPGTFVIAAVRGFSDVGGQPIQAAILRNTEEGYLVMNETGGGVGALINLKAVSPEAAAQTEQILRGLVLTANLSEEPSGLARLVSLAEISSADRTVQLNVKCPAREAAPLLNGLLASP